MFDRTMPGASLEMAMKLQKGSTPEILPRVPYGLRAYREGDELAWCDIETTAGEFERAEEAMARGFKPYFKPDKDLLAERMFFIVDENDVPVATTTAWFDGKTALLHWVAVHGDHQGKGLARPVISAAMRAMERMGYEYALLHTQPESWVAIKLYLEFGFRPVWSDDEKTQIGWRAVYAKLGKEFSKEVCAELE